MEQDDRAQTTDKGKAAAGGKLRVLGVMEGWTWDLLRDGCLFIH